MYTFLFSPSPPLALVPQDICVLLVKRSAALVALLLGHSLLRQVLASLEAKADPFL